MDEVVSAEIGALILACDIERFYNLLFSLS